MPIPSINDELFIVFKDALKTDGATEEEATITTAKLRANMLEQGVRNPRRLAECYADMGLSTGDRLVLKEVLGLNAPAQPAPAALPAVPQVPPTITVSLDKTPRELRDGELIQLFARDKSQDVITAVRERFGNRAFLVMDGARIDAAATLQRLDDGEEGDVFEGKIVATVTEALDREYMADPLEGPAAKLVRRKLDGKDMWKAADGVLWPDAEEARVFVIWARRAGQAWALPDQSPQQRDAVAKAVKDFPEYLPSYMQDAKVRFLSAKAKKDPGYTAADAELRYQPTRRRIETPMGPIPSPTHRPVTRTARITEEPSVDPAHRDAFLRASGRSE